MPDLKEAISIAESFIRDKEFYKGFAIDIANKIERETLWYIPFVNQNPNPDALYLGAYHGLIVDKRTAIFFQPGSAYPLEKWLDGFEMGLLGNRLDLCIEKINDFDTTLHLLETLKMSYVSIEVEGETVWKIPQPYTRKELQKKAKPIALYFQKSVLHF